MANQPPSPSPVEIQARYYAETADRYDDLHMGDVEHQMALAFLGGMIELYRFESVLDVGAGTGRALLWLQRAHPLLELRGVEPVAELRERAAEKGLPEGVLTGGDATSLPFEDGSFDLVCAFGLLHHVRRPDRAVAEMLRVARRAVFLSDCNNFGQGPPPVRLAKRMLRRLGLWPLAVWIKTRGRGYHVSEEDGLAYPYSLFDDYTMIRRACSSVHLLNTRDAGRSLYATASHLAVLGLLSGDDGPGGPA